MKCRKCNHKAVINMRQHKLALCKPHYVEWFQNQTERSIKKYKMFTRNEKILVAVSGGKDSLALWHVLAQNGYRSDGIYIQLGIEQSGYSIDSGKKAAEFAQSHGLNLFQIDVPASYGASIPELAKLTKWEKSKSCSVCGTVKRYLMNKTAFDMGYDVLVTGHNLDDEAAVLFGNTMHWAREMLPRQSPVLEAKHGFIRKAKPFCRFYERETAAYALLQGIDYITEECPYSVGSTSLLYKNLLNQLEDKKPGSKLNFYMTFLNAKKNGLFQAPVEQESSVELVPCQRCGQLTSSREICAFCRLVEKARIRKLDGEKKGGLS